MEYLQHGFNCWNVRAIDEMMDMYTADAEVDVSRLLPDESVMRGRDQIRAYYDRMWETWSGFGWKPCEMAGSVRANTRCSCDWTPRDAEAGLPSPQSSPSSTSWSTA